MTNRIPLLACLVAALSMFGLAAPAEAAGPIKIHKVYFDSPGSDNGSNFSLNNEYVVLKNTGSSARKLTGWSVRDDTGYTYRFGSYTLGAGKYVTIHTGDGDSTQRHRYWGREWYVWNNAGDTARLHRADGTRVDTCTWNGSGSSKLC